jgi:hypothetical protein
MECDLRDFNERMKRFGYAFIVLEGDTLSHIRSIGEKPAHCLRVAFARDLSLLTFLIIFFSIHNNEAGQ